MQFSSDNDLHVTPRPHTPDVEFEIVEFESGPPEVVLSSPDAGASLQI